MHLDTQVAFLHQMEAPSVTRVGDALVFISKMSELVKIHILYLQMLSRHKNIKLRKTIIANAFRLPLLSRRVPLQYHKRERSVVCGAQEEPAEVQDVPA